MHKLRKLLTADDAEMVRLGKAVALGKIGRSKVADLIVRVKIGKSGK